MVCASWRLPPLAAALNSETASFLEKIKRNGGFDFSKAAASKGRVKRPLLNDGFFSFAVVRQIVFLFFSYMLNANFVDFIKI